MKQRRKEIIEYLETHITAETNHLANMFGVTQMTIRRDFDELEKRGLITTIHGGAMINALPTLGSKKHNLVETGEEKRRVAKLASALINDGDTIILDAGSSIKDLASQLDEKKELTILTNSILVMNVLARSDNQFRLIFLPGRFKKSSMACFGSTTNKFLEDFRVDKAFIGAMGYTANDGATITDVEESYTKAKMIEIADQSILLADYTKIGEKYLSKVEKNKKIDILVTDSQSDKEELALIEEMGVKIYIA